MRPDRNQSPKSTAMGTAITAPVESEKVPTIQVRVAQKKVKMTRTSTAAR